MILSTRSAVDDDEDFERYTGMTGERAPVGQLSPQDWMQWRETRAVIAALQAEGAAVRFVGGCVRDALCGRAVRDIDIATPTPPEQTTALLTAAGIAAIPTGIAHGTITAAYHGRTFEITTLRKDTSCDGRHAVVEWTENWREDASRRDFTFNALSARPEDGAVYDYFNGLEHLAHGRVRFIGRADDRIAEDALRILRFFRFFAHYGQNNPHRRALAACQAARERLKDLSVERVRNELLKLLTADTAADVLALMNGLHLWDDLLPQMTNIGRLRQLIFLESRGIKLSGLGPDPLRRLAAAQSEHDASVSQADHLAQFLRLSTLERKRLQRMMAAAQEPKNLFVTTADADFYRHWQRWTSEGLFDGLLLAWAGHRAQEGRTESALTARVVGQLQHLSEVPCPDLPIRGADLLAAGFPVGPEIGTCLESVTEQWVDTCCTASREQCLLWAQQQRAQQAEVPQAF